MGRDTVLGEVNYPRRRLILAGGTRQTDYDDDDACAKSKPATSLLSGDDARKPLLICFLLADGRFVPFEPLRLELEFKTSANLERWRAELCVACNNSRPIAQKPLLTTNGHKGFEGLFPHESNAITSHTAPWMSQPKEVTPP